MSKDRKHFIFTKEYYDIINMAKNSRVRLMLLDAVIQYALNGQEPDLRGEALLLFNRIKDKMKFSLSRYDNGCKGGRPRKQVEPPQEAELLPPPPPPEEVPPPAEIPPPITVEDPPKPRKRGEPPAEDEVIRYFLARGSTEEDARKFYDTFNALGWRNTNGVKIIHWDSKANNWISQNKERTHANIRTSNSSSKVAGYDPNGGITGKLKRNDKGVQKTFPDDI